LVARCSQVKPSIGQVSRLCWQHAFSPEPRKAAAVASRASASAVLVEFHDMTQAMTCHDPHRSGEVLIEVLDVLLSIGVGSIASKKNMTNPLGRGISETISISNISSGPEPGIDAPAQRCGTGFQLGILESINHVYWRKLWRKIHVKCQISPY